MVYAGWMNLGGVELINNARAMAATQNYGISALLCGGCPELLTALEEPPYSGNPAIDQAPWFDEDRPESARFLGVTGLDVTGISKDPVERNPLPLIGDGAALGVLRRTQREITVSVLLWALDDVGLTYGYNFLASALKGSACEAAGVCEGDTLCVFSACPTGDGIAQSRYLYRVGLLDGVEENARHYVSAGGECASGRAACCPHPEKALMAEATFTLVAASPYIYREPIDPLDGAWIDLPSGVLVKDYDPLGLVCKTVTPCLADPSCPDPPLPPPAPVPVNPCWPKAKYVARQSWLTVQPAVMAQWGETVPILEVYTGSKELRRLVVRFHANTAGLPCSAANADPCNACSVLLVTYLPAGSTLVIDGRTRSATVECPQGTAGSAFGTPNLFGPGGEPFSWPVFDCPAGMCVEISTMDSYASPGSMARLRFAGRGDAG